MKIPCILLTGFLGSGKTTFLNWLIQTHPELKISVILNEFGDIKLESNFVSQHTEDIVELANGCMCCVAKADIPRVINYILENSPSTQYIIIEASGLSDPDPIHDAFDNPAISEKVYLHSILCLVDAVNFSQSQKEHSIVMNQVADCDTAILNKIELASTEQLIAIRNFFTSLPSTKLLEFTEQLDPSQFMTSEVRATQDDVNHEHSHELYHTWWFLPDSPLNKTKLKYQLSLIPDSVARVKGYFRDENNVKYLLQMVGKTIEISEVESKSGEATKSALLFIGKELDTDLLAKLLLTTQYIPK